MLAATGCRQIDVYEKTANIPGHAWARNHKAVVELDVNDSTYHDIVFIVRHTEKFKYNNIIATITIQDTAKNTKPLAFIQANIPLVNKSGRWAGENMDDLYYHRVKIDPPLFFKPGRYRFILQHEMKDNPLEHVLNAGVAIQKTSASQ